MVDNAAGPWQTGEPPEGKNLLCIDGGGMYLVLSYQRGRHGPPPELWAEIQMPEDDNANP